MSDKQPIVAIDGPSGVGKSTVAKGVAQKKGYRFIDTGSIYRTVALLSIKQGQNLDDGEAIVQSMASHRFDFDPTGHLFLDGTPVGDEIRTSEVSQGASLVARHPAVRAALLSLQRQLGENGGVVLEGRDIGTVVFPDAACKFFLTASVEERARRRHLELLSKGKQIALTQVIEDQVKRDHQDANRPIAPLRQATDATLIDCENISADEVIDQVCHLIDKKMTE